MSYRDYCAGVGSERNLVMPSGMRLTEVRRLAPVGFQLREGAPSDEDLTFYDTFEWGVWFSGLMLCRRGGELRLVERVDGCEGATVASLDLNGAEPFRFWWDCGAPSMRTRLKSLLKLRALTPVASFSRRIQALEMVNADGKIVARAWLESFHPSGRPRSVFLRLCRTMPMRGYDSEMAAFESALEAAGFAEPARGPLEIFLVKTGMAPERRMGKPVFEIDPGQPARETARVLIRTMLRAARVNESGLIDDIDTEFLHHYRVSLRKIRSVLSLFKGVFPDDACADLKKEFSQIAKRTNRLRDLDVYLLTRSGYEDMLPESMRAGLNEMFDDYAGERTVEHSRVKRYLRSKAYGGKIAVLEDFFCRPDKLPPSPYSGTAIKKLAAARIVRVYKKIRVIANSLDADTPDANIHGLRIQCKKMRYLLEFFAGLFDEDKVAVLTKRLKSLQDKLGLFNDLSVQQASLAEYADGKVADGKAHPRLFLALGGLIAVLNHKHAIQRRLILDGLGEFTDADTRELCSRLFKKPAEV